MGRELRDKYHISSAFVTQVKRMGIIKLIDDKYYWQVGEPNLKMADNIRKKINHAQKKENINNESEPADHSLPSFEIKSEAPQFAISESDLQGMVNIAVKKALAPPVKKRRILKWRNPFYWVTK